MYRSVDTRIPKRLYNYHHYLILERFYDSKKETLFSFAVTSHFLPQPLATTDLYVSAYICLFWTWHIQGIVQYVAFNVCLYTLNIVFSRFIHAVMCISPSFLFFFFCKLRWNSHNRKAEIVKVNNFSGIWCIHNVVQLPLLSSSKYIHRSNIKPGTC